MDRTRNVWGITGMDDVARQGSLRIPEILLFIPMALDGIRVPGTSIPLNEIAAVALVLLALFRSPRADLRIPQWFMVLASGVFLTFLISAQINGVVDVRRLGHLSVVVVLAVVLASGRVDARSAAVGLAIGLPIGVGYGLVFFSQSTYPGRISGIMGDPNTAGMALVVIGCLAVAGLTKRWHQMAVLAVCGVGLWFTLSRTSMLAAAVVAGWVIIGRRLGPFFGAALLAGLTQLIVRFPEEWTLEGRFADREGSDNLRERIEVYEHLVVARSPWVGHGPGTATVDLDGQVFFFHSSYLALRAEAGWLGFVVFLALVVGVLWYVATSRERQRTMWLEAAIIGGLFCAMSLGEVLLAIPFWIALGLAVREAAQTRQAAGEKSPGDKRLDHLLASGPYAGLTTRSS